MKIRVTNSALSDLQGIKEYYADQGVASVGVRLVSEILVHIETLNDHHKIGRVVPEFEDQCIREIIHPPFRVVYFLEARVIHIIRVWRSERILKLPDNEA